MTVQDKRPFGCQRPGLHNRRMPHVSTLLRTAPRADRFLLLITFALTVFVDLVEIVRRLKRRNIRVLLCGVHDELRPALESAGVYALVGADNVCADMREVAQRIASPD